MGQGLGITAEQQQKVVKTAAVVISLLRTNLGFCPGLLDYNVPVTDSLFAKDSVLIGPGERFSWSPSAVLRSLAPVVRYEAVIPRVDRRRALSRLVGRGKSGAGSQQRRALGIALVSLSFPLRRRF